MKYAKSSVAYKTKEMSHKIIPKTKYHLRKEKYQKRSGKVDVGQDLQELATNAPARLHNGPPSILG